MYSFLETNSTGDLVESETGLLIMIVNITLGFFSLFGTLLIGPLSNRFGRKWALLGILGGILFQVVMTVSIVEARLNLHFFVLGAAIRGLTGGVAGIYTIAFSYVTEAHDNRKKLLALRIGILETLSFMAVTLGLLIGGVIIEELDCKFVVPSYLVFAFIVCALLYTFIATSESHGYRYATSLNNSPLPPKAKKVHTGPKSLLAGIQLLFSKDSPRFKLWLCLLIMMISAVNSSGFTAVITLFLLHEPLTLSPIFIGAYLGISEFIHGLVLVIVLPMLLSAGVHDGTIVSLSTLVTISMNTILTFVKADWQVLLGE